MVDDEHLPALRAAVETRRWDDVIGLLEAHWSRVVHEHAAELLVMLESVPDSVLDERPHWIRSRDFLRSRALTTAVPDAAATGLAAHTRRIVDLRRAGRARECLPEIRTCKDLLRAGPVGSEVERMQAELHYQWGRALEEAGSTSEAVDEYEAAARAAPLGTDPDRMRSLAGGAAAFLAAIHGERARTERILAEFCAGGAVPFGGRVSATLAEAFLRFDLLDRDGARQLLEGIDPAGIAHRWAKAFHVRAVIEWEQRASWRLASEVKGHLSTLAPGAVRDADEGHLRITRYLLHAAQGRWDLAHAALGPGPGRGTVLDAHATTLRAYNLVLRGRTAEADDALAPLRTARLHPRSELLMLVVAPRRSPADLERAAALATEHGLYWLLTVLPQDDRRDVSALLARDGSALVSSDALEPVIEPFLSPLTERERAVGERAALGASLADIAAELHVSTNTVKTQLRTVYRKLHVSSRSDLLTALRRFDR